MSDDTNDDSSHSSSDESEDIAVTGLVATRAKRQTAGNRYEITLGDYDDPDLQALFAEADGESEDYEGSDQDGDDDDAMDSSSSDEDAGPPKDGEPEDLEGEKELKKAERAEQNKKRKAQQAKLAVPAWTKKTKRVTLANEVHADDGSSSAIDAPMRKKKKSERTDWRPSGNDLPTRQSARSSAVAFRETIHVNLQESAERSRKHKTALNDTKRERVNRRLDLTLGERLENCRSIEKETAKELGRFEREEAERVRLREEALLAKRRRVLDGPLFRTLTTSALYENGKLKVKRLVHGSQPVNEILAEHQSHDEALQGDTIDSQPETLETSAVQQPPAAQQPLDLPQPVKIQEQTSVEEQPQLEVVTTVVEDANEDSTVVHPATDELKHEEANITSTSGPAIVVTPTAAQPTPSPPAEDHDVKMEAAEETSHVNGDQHEEPQPQPQQAQASGSTQPEVDDNAALPSEKTEDMNPANTSAVDAASVEHPASDTSAIPPPIIREQAQRHLVTLDDFPNLEVVVTKRSKALSTVEPTPIAQVLMPDSYPTFTDEEAAYLRKNRKSKQELYPKQLCALTSWQGKYRDPNTGIVFADVPAYKMLQRLIAGGCRWNSMLECWSAPFVGLIGRPAHGVPEGFDVPAKSSAQGAN